MLTVLLATYNGARTLPRVLDAYQRLVIPGGTWQLIVVDNASTDDTPSLLAHHAQRLPLLPLHAPRRGKNVALNIGLEQARGDLVVLTDDDALAAPDWLQMLAAAADARPDHDIFGGTIEPIWPDPMPEWILRLVPLGATFSITDAGWAEGPCRASRIWGPNMAVRRRVFAAGHRFDERVGPQEGQYIMGSEVEFTCRVERLGHNAWFVPQARVGHLIREHQLRREWIVQRAFRLGRHMYHQERPCYGRLPLWRGAPRFKYRRLLDEHGKRLLAMLRDDIDAKFRADWELSFLRGYLAEAARNSGGSTP